MGFQWRRRTLSPLMLLIFISFFTTVLSKHRIRHHRDRFKRQQGAHLYLAGSYVTEGGDGPDSGSWSEWSSPSACSRTCGGGVSTEHRTCQQGFTCQGPTMRHYSCNTQDCPDTGDFRAQQCSEFDSIPFEGVLYQWVPYTKAPNPCELNCMPKGERFYYRHKAQVVDGTRCSDENLDVCVQGTCQPVGCDMMLGSSAKEDRCRRCGGDGSTCNTVTGLLDMQDLQAGYNDILLIPSGATNIQVQEVAPSNNYLAIRNTSGHYYLNGNWRIDFPRTMDFAGCKFHYERYPQGFSAPDKITCLGPIDEAVFIVLLSQDRNVGVNYEYSLPTNIQPGSENETYAWTFDQFSACSVTCGGGLQHRNVTCAGRKTLEPVDRSLCDTYNEPAAIQKCGEIACEAQWVPYPWGNCSEPCGDGGIQTREVSCQQIVSNGFPTIVDEKECLKIQPKPPTQQTCNKGRICATWHTAPWKPCDHLCGDGKETRNVRCHRKEGKNIELLDAEECIAVEPKPESERTCNVRPCEGVDWITSEWSGCEGKCGLTNETRKAHCASASGKIYSEELCDKDKKPELIRECQSTNASCDYLWYASQWSECSAKCGTGVQTRTLFCGLLSKEGEVKKVEKDKCDNTRTYETIRNCTAEVKECPGEWYSGPWTECSKPCGGGEKTKKVICLKDDQLVSVEECDSSKIIFSREDCNSQPCSEDTIIPTDITKSIDESETESATTEMMETEKTDDDEYEIVPDDECDDGEWVDDEGVPESSQSMDEELGASTEAGITEKSPETSFSLDDLMLSDAPASIADIFSTDIGSGDGELTSPSGISTLDSEITIDSKSTDLLESTLEGSGDTSGSTVSGSDTSFDFNSSPSTESAENITDVTISTDLTATTEELVSGSTDLMSTTESVTEVSSVENNMTDSTQTSEDSESSITTEVTETTENTKSTETTEGTESTESSSVTSESTETTETSESSSPSDESSTTPEPPVVVESDFGSDNRTESAVTSTQKADMENITVTTEITDTTTEFTGSTEVTTEITGSTELVTELTESTTEFTGSTESTTEFTGSTESVITESTEKEEISTTEFDIWSSTTESADTEESTSSDLWGTTPIIDIFATQKPRMCKRKKQKDCKKSKHGCCWDKITPAEGPFGKGCPTPKTCKESKYGCCEDGVSPALGRKFKGCPPSFCNQTLFGCCPDNKTAAEGSKKEGCPPPPPACLKSRYGCCKDNVTAATGPKQKGCEKEKQKTTTTEPPPTEDCSNSTYGCCPDGIKSAQGEYFKGCDIFKDNCTESYFNCCPDGVTSAEGPNYKGCKMPCTNSSYGCCPDGITAAHGHAGEGCCLAGPYGCCPDNILPARGPNLEGCGCQYSPYGCCPDNATAARGYNKEGCGCQHTQHGCCPDNYTPADGPDYLGCLCHTFQFGCCPDGVTVAKGPHQQGCGCRNTEFGCCSDDQTPAKGPNHDGCGCDSSKHGCCPDGVNEARGENFEGCENIPINLQDSCTLEKDRGPCRNYTVKWFFDMAYAGCSRFWYGGCDGNDNRFKSKEECDGICVKPEGQERCNLPKMPGPCSGYYPQWYYDKDRKHCAQFIYGGCLGNNNRFETREDCMQLCVKDSSVDACEQVRDEGPCKGNYRRWYYDKETKSCQQFIYGGCRANNNNFPTEEACKQQCTQSGRKKDHCSLPRAQGNCTAREPRWYYDIPQKRCVPFYYSGCNGNNNNFNSREACEADCPTEVEKDLCYLRAEPGECANYSERWYFDTKEKLCKQFYYGGCGGNGNNFESQQMCQNRCDSTDVTTTTTTTTTVASVEAPVSFRTEFCFLPNATGPCRTDVFRYFYDSNDGVCKSFVYGGCEGNQNNFESIEKCLQNCGNSQDLCLLPPIVGPCDGEYEQFYFDPRSDECLSFNYGGCGGNYNRFQEKASCEQKCKKSPSHAEEPLQTHAPPVETDTSDVSMCYEPADSGNCNGSSAEFFFNITSRACMAFSYSGCGGNANRFSSEEQCERQCGSFRGQDVCSLPRESGPCRGYFIKYYYDQGAGRCGQFVYGGCNGNGNRFSSNEECEQICVTHEERKTNVTSTTICQLPVDQGSCEGGYHKRWYFNNDRGECIAFIYSGCGGNFNNFKTFQSCVDFCKDYLAITPPPFVNPESNEIDTSPSCQEHFDECATLRCAYGIEAYVDKDKCNRCQCHEPCSNVNCPSETQCAIDLNRNRTSHQDPNFIAVCRNVSKEGICPNLESVNTNCEQECRNDADCAMDLKCCQAGSCGTSCVLPVIEVPAELVTQAYLPAYTQPIEEAGYSPPKVNVEIFEPEVQAPIGDHVTLRCAVTGNPTPQITWRKENLIIDGTQAKYRIKLDQSLQIITLHKTDSGIYLCTADNNIGEPVTNQIKLDVIDSSPRPAAVLDQEQPNMVVSLNAPATLNCLALGFPFPAVTWWKDDSLIPLKTSQFEVRKDYSLLIHSVKLTNLGIYTCQAYNGVGKAASWSVTVQARGPYHSTNPDEQKYLKYIINPPELPSTTVAPPKTPWHPFRPQHNRLPYRPTPQPYVPPPYTEPSPEIDPNEIVPQPGPESQPNIGDGSHLVPVRTNISLVDQRFALNSTITIPCIVEGNPPPQVQWYKDGVALHPTDRIEISERYTLTIREGTKADSGIYQCEAANSFSKSSSAVTILVEGMYIHPNCTDNRFFANCELIVRAKYCTHAYYARFCCRSCTKAGLLPVDGPHLTRNIKKSLLNSNLI